MAETTSKLILALETSGRHGSVAVLRGDETLSQGKIEASQRTASAMTPLIAEVLRSGDLRLAEIDIVGVTIGPGSFTGLRVGVTTAKTLAYVTKCQVIGVNTLDAIACQAPSSVASVWVVIDAQRQQLFAAYYERDAAGRMVERRATHLIDKQDWLHAFNAGDAVMGPGLNKLQSDLPAEIQVIDNTLWEPTAASVGAVTHELFKAGQRDDVWKLAPLYFRPSAAEEKLNK